MEHRSDPKFWSISVASPQDFFFVLPHKRLGLSNGECVQCFTHDGLSDFHAFVCLSAKRVLARVLRIERLDSVAARFFPGSSSGRILARFLYIALYLLPDLHDVSMGSISVAKKA